MFRFTQDQVLGSRFQVLGLLAPNPYNLAPQATEGSL